VKFSLLRLTQKMPHQTVRKWGAIVALTIFLFDRISKWWIVNIVDLPLRRSIEVLPFFDLSMVWNRGVSFGLFQAGSVLGRVILVSFSLLMVTLLINWLLKAEKPIQAIFLGMIIGGALGNALDRVIYGAVVDFLDFSGLGFKWVFNVADASISVGVGLLVLDGFFAKDDSEKRDRQDQNGQ
jgi:signal peptidase II